MNESFLIRLIVFLVINFAALAIGGLFTGSGVSSDWYQTLNKAPWTPPGWAFGTAWTTIMVCFSIYMAYLWPMIELKQKLIVLYLIQLVLNISWNPAFFYLQNVLLGLIIISFLTILVGYILYEYRSRLELKSILILPYFLWLLIATSLNVYILINN